MNHAERLVDAFSRAIEAQRWLDNCEEQQRDWARREFIKAQAHFTLTCWIVDYDRYCPQDLVADFLAQEEPPSKPGRTTTLPLHNDDLFTPFSGPVTFTPNLGS